MPRNHFQRRVMAVMVLKSTMRYVVREKMFPEFRWTRFAA